MFFQNLFEYMSDSITILTPAWIAVSLLFGILIGILDRRRDSVFGIVTEILLVGYVALILGSTVLLRGQKLTADPSLSPFSTYRGWISGAHPRFLYEDVSNILMTVPVGLGVSVLAKRLRALKALGITVVLEVMIEACQYLLRRGVCEIDDVINGAIGALIGYVFYLAGAGVVRLVTGIQKRKEKSNYV